MFKVFCEKEISCSCILSMYPSHSTANNSSRDSLIWALVILKGIGEVVGIEVEVESKLEVEVKLEVELESLESLG